MTGVRGGKRIHEVQNLKKPTWRSVGITACKTDILRDDDRSRVARLSWEAPRRGNCRDALFEVPKLNVD
jgi:hypothetical protein